MLPQQRLYRLGDSRGVQAQSTQTACPSAGALPSRNASLDRVSGLLCPWGPPSGNHVANFTSLQILPRDPESEKMGTKGSEQMSSCSRWLIFVTWCLGKTHKHLGASVSLSLKWGL